MGTVIIPNALKMLPCIAQKKLTLARHELQEVVVLLWQLITQVGLILTSKAEHLFDAFGIKLELELVE